MTALLNYPLSDQPNQARHPRESGGPSGPLPTAPVGAATTREVRKGPRLRGDDGRRNAADGRAPFTGRHMAAIMIGFFTVVISVNVTMARLASATFGGVVVENSYVASQHFNRWLDEAASEKALGWQADLARASDGRVALTLAGPKAAEVIAVARHPLGHRPDVILRFEPAGPGRFVSREGLPAGRWRVRLEARDGTTKIWRSEGEVR